MTNILLNLQDEPKYDRIQTADIRPAMESAIPEARAAIADIKTTDEPTWNNTIFFINIMSKGLSYAEETVQLNLVN